MQHYQTASVARQTYRNADSMARKLGIKRCLYSRDRHDIHNLLRAEFGTGLAASVMHIYSPAVRNRATIKELFALFSLTSTAENFWRTTQTEYGYDSPVSESAHGLYLAMEESYTSVAIAAGGFVSIDENCKVVDLANRAFMNARDREFLNRFPLPEYKPVQPIRKFKPTYSYITPFQSLSPNKVR